MSAHPSPMPGDFLERLASAHPAPGGIAACAWAAAMGLALWEKALHHPPEGVAPGTATADLAVITAIRLRLTKLVVADERQVAALATARAATAPEPGRIRGAQLGVYRTACQLLELTIQGLTQLPVVLDYGSTGMLADIDCGWRLQSTAMEAAIGCCEAHLKSLDDDLIGGEPQALEQQASRGRELSERARGALSWRRGRC